MDEKQKLQVLEKENEKLQLQIERLQRQLNLHKETGKLNEELRNTIQKNKDLHKELCEHKHEYIKLCKELSNIITKVKGVTE